MQRVPELPLAPREQRPARNCRDGRFTHYPRLGLAPTVWTLLGQGMLIRQALLLLPFLGIVLI